MAQAPMFTSAPFTSLHGSLQKGFKVPAPKPHLGSWHGQNIIAIGPLGGKIIGYVGGKPVYASTPQGNAFAAHKQKADVAPEDESPLEKIKEAVLGWLGLLELKPTASAGEVFALSVDDAAKLETFGVSGKKLGPNAVGFHYTAVADHVGKPFVPKPEHHVVTTAAMAAGKFGDNAHFSSDFVAGLKVTGSLGGSHGGSTVESGGVKCAFKENGGENGVHVSRAEEVFDSVAKLIFPKPEAFPHAQMVQMDGTMGVLLEWMPGEPLGKEMGPHAVTDAKLKKFAYDLIQHEVVDWLMGNHDSHGANFHVDGNKLIALDKGQAFKKIGTDKLEPHKGWKLDGNGSHEVYVALWQGFKNGSIPLDEKKVVVAVAEVMAGISKISEEQYHLMVLPYIEDLQAKTGANPTAKWQAIKDRFYSTKSDWEAFLSDVFGHPVSIPSTLPSKPAEAKVAPPVTVVAPTMVTPTQAAAMLAGIPEAPSVAAQKQAFVTLPEAPAPAAPAVLQVPGWPITKGNVTVHAPGTAPPAGVQWKSKYPGPGFHVTSTYKGKAYEFKFSVKDNAPWIDVTFPDGKSHGYASFLDAADSAVLFDKGHPLDATATEKKSPAHGGKYNVSYSGIKLWKLDDFAADLVGAASSASATPAAPAAPEEPKVSPAATVLTLGDEWAQVLASNKNGVVVADKALLPTIVQQHLAGIDPHAPVYIGVPLPGSVFLHKEGGTTVAWVCNETSDFSGFTADGKVYGYLTPPHDALKEWTAQTATVVGVKAAATIADALAKHLKSGGKVSGPSVPQILAAPSGSIVTTTGVAPGTGHVYTKLDDGTWADEGWSSFPAQFLYGTQGVLSAKPKAPSILDVKPAAKVPKVGVGVTDAGDFAALPVGSTVKEGDASAPTWTKQPDGMWSASSGAVYPVPGMPNGGSALFAKTVLSVGPPVPELAQWEDSGGVPPDLTPAPKKSDPLGPGASVTQPTKQQLSDAPLHSLIVVGQPPYENTYEKIAPAQWKMPGGGLAGVAHFVAYGSEFASKATKLVIPELPTTPASVPPPKPSGVPAPTKATGPQVGASGDWEALAALGAGSEIVNNMKVVFSKTSAGQWQSQGTGKIFSSEDLSTQPMWLVAEVPAKKPLGVPKQALFNAPPGSKFTNQIGTKTKMADGLWLDEDGHSWGSHELVVDTGHTSDPTDTLVVSTPAPAAPQGKLAWTGEHTPTAAALDALPVGTVIVAETGDEWTKMTSSAWGSAGDGTNSIGLGTHGVAYTIKHQPGAPGWGGKKKPSLADLQALPVGSTLHASAATQAPTLVKLADGQFLDSAGSIWTPQHVASLPTTGFFVKVTDGAPAAVYLVPETPAPAGPPPVPATPLSTAKLPKPVTALPAAGTSASKPWHAVVETIWKHQAKWAGQMVKGPFLGDGAHSKAEKSTNVPDWVPPPGLVLEGEHNGKKVFAAVSSAGYLDGGSPTNMTTWTVWGESGISGIVTSDGFLSGNPAGLANAMSAVVGTASKPLTTFEAKSALNLNEAAWPAGATATTVSAPPVAAVVATNPVDVAPETKAKLVTVKMTVSEALAAAIPDLEFKDLSQSNGPSTDKSTKVWAPSLTVAALTAKLKSLGVKVAGPGEPFGVDVGQATKGGSFFIDDDGHLDKEATVEATVADAVAQPPEAATPAPAPLDFSSHAATVTGLNTASNGTSFSYKSALGESTWVKAHDGYHLKTGHYLTAGIGTVNQILSAASTLVTVSGPDGKVIGSFMPAGSKVATSPSPSVWTPPGNKWAVMKSWSQDKILNHLVGAPIGTKLTTATGVVWEKVADSPGKAGKWGNPQGGSSWSSMGAHLQSGGGATITPPSGTPPSVPAPVSAPPAKPQPPPKKVESPEEIAAKAAKKAEHDAKVAKAKSLVDWKKAHPVPAAGSPAAKALPYLQAKLGKLMPVWVHTDGLKVLIGSPNGPHALQGALSSIVSAPWASKTQPSPLGDFLEVDAATFTGMFPESGTIKGPDGKDYPHGTTFAETQAPTTTKKTAVEALPNFHKGTPDTSGNTDSYVLKFKFPGGNKPTQAQVTEAKVAVEQAGVTVHSVVPGSANVIVFAKESDLATPTAFKTTVKATVPEQPVPFVPAPTPKEFVASDSKQGAPGEANHALLGALDTVKLGPWGQAVRIGNPGFLRNGQMKVRKVTKGGESFYEVTGDLLDFKPGKSKLLKGNLHVHVTDEPHAAYDAETGAHTGLGSEMTSSGYAGEVGGTSIEVGDPAGHTWSYRGHFAVRIPEGGDYEAELRKALVLAVGDEGADKVLAPHDDSLERVWKKAHIVKAGLGPHGFWDTDAFGQPLDVTKYGDEAWLDAQLKQLKLTKHVDTAKIVVGAGGAQHVEIGDIDTSNVAFLSTGTTESKWVVDMLGKGEGNLSRRDGYTQNGTTKYSGASAGPDMNSGGGMHLFTRLQTKSMSDKLPCGVGNGSWRAVYHPRVLQKSTLSYYKNDTYGAVSENAPSSGGFSSNATKRQGVQNACAGSPLDSNEACFVDGIGLKDVAGISCSDNASRDEVLEGMKKQYPNITEVNGIPLEKFIFVASKHHADKVVAACAGLVDGALP